MKKPTNKGFEALPKKVQDIILKRMEMGGGLDRADDYGTKKKPYPSVSSSDFAGGHRSYPIPTKADAVDALRLAGLHGRSDVKAKVYAKYPGLKKQFGGENVPVGYHMMPDGTIMRDDEMDTYQPIVNSENPPMYKMGGGNLYKFVGNEYKNMGGSHSPQGESMDEFLTNKNADFVNYIANNTKAALFKNDAMDLQKGFAQMGQEVEGEPRVNLLDPNDPLKPKGPQYSDFMQGPFGMYSQGNETPQYVTDFTKQFNFPEVYSNTGTPSNLNLNPYGDVMNNSKPSYNFTTEDAVDLTMFGIQGANSFFNRANEMEQEKQLKKKRTIENVVTPFYGSRGDYDVNQGNFRVDQKTPISYKKGGQYNLSDSEIAAMLGQGYLIEFID